MSNVPLRDYLEGLIATEVRSLNIELAAAKEATEAAFRASQKAIDKAEEALTRRLEGMNEIRDQLREQAETFARVEVVATENAGRDERITRVERFQAKMLGGLLLAPFVSAVLAGLVVYSVTH